MRKALVLTSILSAALLTGCESNTGDLQDWINEIKARPAGSIQPAPDVEPTPSFEYSAMDLRSPFAQLEPEIEAELQIIAEGCDASVQPDPNRRREDLERYSLDSMEMVGAMTKSSDKWGLVKMTNGPATGKVFKVSTGNYMGINHGRIVDIDEFRIVLETLVPDGQGCWEKRVVNMALND